MNADYVIVTDATADLRPEMVREMDLQVVPMTFAVNGKEWVYHPGQETASLEAFHEALHAGHPVTTSQVNGAVYEGVFAPHLEAGRDLLYIGFSSGLSGMHAGALQTADRLKMQFPDRRLVVVDSLCASVGQGLLVHQAAQRRKQGWSLDRLERWLLENRLAVCHWFRVEDLMHLKRGGRISSASAVMGTALQVKPVLCADRAGKLKTAAKIRGRKKSLACLVQALKDGFDPGQCPDVWICHVDAVEEARKLEEMVTGQMERADVSVLPVGPIIGAHTGPGMVGLVFFGQQRDL